jgi:hypothetical protein
MIAGEGWSVEHGVELLFIKPGKNNAKRLCRSFLRGRGRACCSRLFRSAVACAELAKSEGHSGSRNVLMIFPGRSYRMVLGAVFTRTGATERATKNDRRK